MKFISPKKLRELGVLGMNRRNVNYIARCNPRSRFPLVDNKLKTKHVAQEHGMAVPELYGVVSFQYQIRDLLQLLDGLESFVIKPVQGSGGKGILVIAARRGEEFIKSTGGVLSFSEIKRHVSNILSGLYSLGGRPDTVMIEALIDFDEYLVNYSYEGVPDIRVIVYTGVPVMAMLRCSTHASDGKANLHQGAVGVGLDIVTGCSRYAVQNERRVSRHPDTGYSFEHLSIPHWETILELASGCYEMTGLGYFGADLVLDRNRGPVILELNARPGLAIQIANQAGLRRRLEMVDKQLQPSMNKHARIALSKSLFAH
ncbi:MAG: alpha-L-glutamate ligase-like protein [Porticoccaceae bacterium]|nr:alpha-L-glutamate ligase-like protein [Pseudomonadales bacterium]MCP5170942.1 alpha-L-glutamate ligase-like protein [Pseudomonadales bacterium]MCP5301818.1 alpha-L-glutamate ligase-like protein [Pseudomonadales bacterium]